MYAAYTASCMEKCANWRSATEVGEDLLASAPKLMFPACGDHNTHVHSSIVLLSTQSCLRCGKWWALACTHAPRTQA